VAVVVIGSLQDFGSKLFYCTGAFLRETCGAAAASTFASSSTAAALFVQFRAQIPYRITISNATNNLNAFSAAPCGNIARSRVQRACPPPAFTDLGKHDSAAFLQFTANNNISNSSISRGIIYSHLQ
jgi:hypothetical protein